MFLSSLIFIISLLVLIISAQFFTVAAEKLGLHLGMSPFVIGVFIVGIGTSLPELVAGVLAGFSGNSEIVSGNVLGANISNIFLILGLIAVLSRKGIELGDGYIMVDLNFLIRFSLPVFVVASVLFYLLTQDKKISPSEGMLFLVFYAFFISKAVISFI